MTRKCLRCGGQCDSQFVANFLMNSTMEKFRKYINICQSYGQKYRGPFFDSQCIIQFLPISNLTKPRKLFVKIFRLLFKNCLFRVSWMCLELEPILLRVFYRTDNYDWRRASVPNDESGWNKDRHVLQRTTHTLSNDHSAAAESNFRIQKQTGGPINGASFSTILRLLCACYVSNPYTLHSVKCKDSLHILQVS